MTWGQLHSEFVLITYKIPLLFMAVSSEDVEDDDMLRELQTTFNYGREPPSQKEFGL